MIYLLIQFTAVYEICIDKIDTLVISALREKPLSSGEEVVHNLVFRDRNEWIETGSLAK